MTNRTPGYPRECRGRSSLKNLIESGCGSILDIEAVGFEPFGVSSDRDRLDAGVFYYQTA
jgi:hypothetical protein